MALARVAAETAAMASAIALAHLMPPAEFGKAAVALIVHTVATALVSQGFGSALVQRETVERRHLEVATAMSVAAGLALAAATWVLAPYVAQPIFGEDVAGLVRLAAPMFVLSAMNVIPHAQLTRRLDFRRTSLVELASLYVGVGVTLVLALAGLDAAALVLGMLARSTAASIQLWWLVPPVRPRLHRAAARELLGFGAPAAGASMLNTLLRSVDRGIVAAQLGPAAAGFYWRAWQLGLEYQTKISGIMQRIAFPVFSRTRGMEDLRALRLRIVRLHATVLFPLLTALIVLAPVAVPFLYGEAWRPAVIPAQLLAGCGMVAVVLTGTGPLLMAVGRPSALLVYNGVNAAVFLSVVLATAPYGLIAVCAGFLGVQLVSLVAANHFLLGRIAGIPLRDTVADIAPAVVASAVAGLAGTLAAAVVDPDDVTAAGHIVIVGGLVVAIYVGVVRTGFPAVWADVCLVARRASGRRRKNHTTAAAAAGA